MQMLSEKYYKKILNFYTIIYICIAIFFSILLVISVSNWPIVIILEAGLLLFVIPVIITMSIKYNKAKKADTYNIYIGKIIDFKSVITPMIKPMIYAVVKLPDGRVCQTHPVFEAEECEKLQDKEIQISLKNDNIKSFAYALMVL